MSEGKNTTILMTAIFLVFIAIAIYFLFFREEEDYKPPDNGGNGGNGNGEDPPPGMDIIHLDKITSYTQKIRFELGGSYYANLLSGHIRAGGFDYTYISIYYSQNGSWTKLGRVSGWPGGTIPFEYSICDHCDLIIFEVEWGVAPRYIDEVHGQLFVEVG